MNPWRHRRPVAGTTLAAALSLALFGCASGPAASGHAAFGQATQPAPAGFAWFRPGSPPAAWQRVSLPGQRATLSYPGSLRPQRTDHGTVTFGRDSRSGTVLVYLNVTPRQGDETLRDWPGFRLDHLRQDGTTAVHLDGVSPLLDFRGGRGRCVIDSYITKVHQNHYREIACFVQGSHAANVLVAATSVNSWRAYQPLLDRVVSSYRRLTNGPSQGKKRNDRSTPMHGNTLTGYALRLGTATALVVDAVVHLQDAHFYDANAGALLTQGQLFRIQAVVAIAAAVAVLVWPRWPSWLFAALVSASAAAAVVAYTYLDIGPVAGLPRMYEPSWAPGQLSSAYAEAAGTLLALAGLAYTLARSRRRAAAGRAPRPGDAPSARLSPSSRA